MGKLVFCYWNLRGIGAPVINMLEYAGIEYEKKILTSAEDWFKEKYNLGLDFPNLPYIIDGDVRMTESWAIYKYVGKKAGLVPPAGDEYERQAHILEGVIQEFRLNFGMHCYNPDFYHLATGLLAAQSKKLDRMEHYLVSRKFLVGDKLTYLDFVFYETLDHQRLFFTNMLVKYPNVTAYIKRFESLDRIKSFFQSDRYHQFPINTPAAAWGGEEYNDKR